MFVYYVMESVRYVNKCAANGLEAVMLRLLGICVNARCIYRFNPFYEYSMAIKEIIYLLAFPTFIRGLQRN